MATHSSLFSVKNSSHTLLCYLFLSWLILGISSEAMAQSASQQSSTNHSSFAQDVQSTSIRSDRIQTRRFRFDIGFSLGKSNPQVRMGDRENVSRLEPAASFGFRMEGLMRLSSFLHWSAGLDYTIATNRLIYGYDSTMDLLSTGLVVGKLNQSRQFYASSAIGIGRFGVSERSFLSSPEEPTRKRRSTAVRFAIGRTISDKLRIELSHTRLQDNSNTNNSNLSNSSDENLQVTLINFVASL